MTEKPILFSKSMILAILDNRKKQTRRVIKFPLNCLHLSGNPVKLLNDWALSKIGKLKNGVLEYEYQNDVDDSRIGKIKCPYGAPGNQLWVRETFHQHYMGGLPCYKADDNCKETDVINWKPSIFMPRWASRIQLEIKDIRIERIQDISEEDAKAEGIEWGEGAGSNPRVIFSNLWDSINEKRGFGWGLNPWVWVIDFERIKP